MNMINGANDLFAFKLDISLNVMTWIGRIGSVLFPVLAYMITYRLCLGFQHHDREVLEHGVETGLVRRTPTGEFYEVHQPLGGVDEHGHAIPLEYQGAAVPKKANELGAAGRAVPGVWSPKDEDGVIDYSADGAAESGEPESAGELTRS
jgi:ubiquinol-cytochrome c reductase cytochrome b subunit